MVEVNLGHKDMVESYNLLYNIRMSEINYTNLFAWQDKYNFHVLEVNEFLFVVNLTGDQMYFSQPIGPLNDLSHLKDTLLEVMDMYKLETITLKKCSHYFKAMVEALDLNVSAKEVREDFDYIYDFEGLKHLRGKLYHKKKNHVNHFIKHYHWTYKPIDGINIGDVMDVVDHWFYNADAEGLHEKKAILRLLNHWSSLNVSGGVLYVEERPVAFAIGEVIHGDTLLMHFEKGITDYQGVYTMMTNLYINEFEGLRYVNREQDLGIAGLRKSKLSYHPVDFISKYNLTIKR